MMKTAIIGASGFVGRHLFAAYRSICPDTIGTSFSRADGRLLHFDIRQPKLAALGLRETGYEAVLIASAKANVAYCETNRDEAYAVNVRGMLELIRQAAALGLRPIFLSSDYVFDGRTGGYDDDARTSPATEYGRHKQLVEQELPNITDRYLILRLSKIYGLQKGDGTLLDECAAAITSGRELRAADDQVFCPTYVTDLVQAIIGIQKRGLTGVFNVCSPERWSRYQVATALARAMGFDEAVVTRIALHDLPSMAGRPLNTSMMPSRLGREFGCCPSPLKDSLLRVAANWRGEQLACRRMARASAGEPSL
jgi:dTDP-4-dehydrorhamnose reductase